MDTGGNIQTVCLISMWPNSKVAPIRGRRERTLAIGLRLGRPSRSLLLMGFKYVSKYGRWHTQEMVYMYKQ